MLDPKVEETIQAKYEQLAPYLNETGRRIWAAVEALSLGHGGVTSVCRATGLSRTTIHGGIDELESTETAAYALEEYGAVRRKGGGRKPVTESDSTVLEDLEQLIDPATRGDPESSLRWSTKSTTQLAQELQAKGHQVSQRTVCRLLWEMGYSLQSNRKTQEGKSHIDRDAQFEQISQSVKQFQQRHQPVISVDAKKKELIGNYKQTGVEWEPKGEPTLVKTHDFVDKQLGKVIPYGLYDLSLNQGWVSVGIDHDTAQLAVATIEQWWEQMGQAAYPSATELLITADCGGSNNYRTRLWKWELQQLATKLGLSLHVAHFPPGTSKWNKIEHRLFAQITRNWRGRPLVSREVVVNLIANTTTTTGLNVKAALDEGCYPTGIEITDEQFDSIHLEKDDFHGEWNYKILPQAI
ncbi:MAG TPA: ISAzo13 family transposase [Coleofasciculaceae cyanobacterium]|jgi:transposase